MSAHGNTFKKLYFRCFDQSSLSDDNEPYFCRKNKDFPKGYERTCCRENLCNGNYTIPYHFEENSYSTENMFLLTSVCAVIFLTLIAFILFFSCRMDLTWKLLSDKVWKNLNCLLKFLNFIKCIWKERK